MALETKAEPARPAGSRLLCTDVDSGDGCRKLSTPLKESAGAEHAETLRCREDTIVGHRANEVWNVAGGQK